MNDILKKYRPHAKDKYYLFIQWYIEKILNDPKIKLHLRIKDIIKGSPITRPTFYNYFKNSEHFYKELMEIIAKWLPHHMAEKSKQMKVREFLDIAYSMKIGILVNNIRKAADLYPSIEPYWKSYYENANKQITVWYVNELGMEVEMASRNARFVVNELIINCDHYYSHPDTYKMLMLEQKAAPLTT